MAAFRASTVTCPGLYLTVAFSVARFTLAERTPSIASSASSMMPAQDAHIMPLMPKVT